MAPDYRQRLLELVNERALLRGDFTLVSGAKASYFFDLKMVTLSAEGAYVVGKVLFDMLKDIDIAAVGGLTLGADPIVTAVAIVSHLEGVSIPAFIERGVEKDHGTQKGIEGYLPEEGEPVAIVEDVITTGGATLKAIELAEAAGCRVEKIVTILDRHAGGSDEVRRRGYDFAAVLHSDAAGNVSLG
ncbi:MAG: orotate phosphoribosyltransferase [Chloroflexota bacterium]|nr:orotate phosphoribosyltransferase [Chloroflexota bacterium]